jgi:hypothetical protein
MATIFHQIQYWTYNIPAGGSLWLSYGPGEQFKDGTVQVSCCASTDVGDHSYTQTLSVPEIFITSVPHIVGDIFFKDVYVGFNIVNRGQNPINFFSVALTVINP